MASYDHVMAHLNRLIDWYEKFNPSAGQKFPVPLTPERLWKATGHVAPPPDGIYPKEVQHRGRTVVSAPK